MKSALSVISPLLLIVLYTCQSAYSWDCSVSLDGPTWVKIDHPISLTASGLPAGGQYYWSATPNLVPNGSTATLTGFKPTFSDYVRVTVRYITPRGNSCSDTKWVYAHLGDCQVALDGGSAAPVGALTFVTATGQPTGGSCNWLSPTGLLTGLFEQNMTAQFTAQSPGLQTFKAEYTTPSGDTCTGTHDTTFFKVGSITSPYTCVNSGSTLAPGLFIVTSEPPGFLNISSLNLTISPLTFTTIFPTSEQTITASIAPNSIFDDAYTKILVVNKDNKEEVSVEIKIPNYVNDTLKLIGVGDKTDLKLEGKYSRFSECCSGTSVKNSTSGSTTIGLYANSGPFTIIGIPLPPRIKQYVTLDALAVSVSGSGSASIKGDYDSCLNITSWSGSGSLKAGIEVGGEVKAKTSDKTIVLQGTLNGNTAVLESIKVEPPNIAIAGNWEGLKVNGQVVLRLWNLKFVDEPVSWTLLEERKIPQITMPLPSLR